MYTRLDLQHNELDMAEVEVASDYNLLVASTIVLVEIQEWAMLLLYIQRYNIIII